MNEIIHLPFLYPFFAVIWIGNQFFNIIENERYIKLWRIICTILFFPVSFTTFIFIIPFVLILVLFTPLWWLCLIIFKILQKRQ